MANSKLASKWFSGASLGMIVALACVIPGAIHGGEGPLGNPAPDQQQAADGDPFPSPMTLVEIGPQPGKGGVVTHHLVESAGDAWKLAEKHGLHVTVVAGPFNTRRDAANEAKKRGLLDLRITTIDRDGKEDTASANQLALALAGDSLKPGNQPLEGSLMVSLLPGGFGVSAPQSGTATSAAPTVVKPPAEEDDGKRASIVSFSGKITVRFKSGEEMVVTPENFERIKLRRGDKVITAFGAKLKIKFFDGSTGDVGEGELTM